MVGFAGRFVEERRVDIAMRVLEVTALPWRAFCVEGRRGDRVRVVAGVPDSLLPEHLNAMDLLLAPSQTTARWREQFGCILIEAFACGVRVLASDSGEFPYVVANAGVIVGERDEMGWRRMLADLLESPARRAEFAARGRDRAHALYSWPVVARRHLEFFNELLTA